MEINSLYQFRYYIKGINPLIWRRLLIKGSHTLADLHHSIQMSYGWTNYHLHQFTIRGKTYGIYSGYMEYAEDADQTTIECLNLRKNEKFLYEYNFTSNWKVEARLEKISEIETNRSYPICLSGSRSGPPEDCGGAHSYMELDEYYSDYKIMEIIANRVDEIKEDGDDIDCLRGTLNELEYWVKRNKFDRNEANLLLNKFANRTPDWEDYMDEMLYL